MPPRGSNGWRWSCGAFALGFDILAHSDPHHAPSTPTTPSSALFLIVSLALHFWALVGVVGVMGGSGGLVLVVSSHLAGSGGSGGSEGSEGPHHLHE